MIYNKSGQDYNLVHFYTIYYQPLFKTEPSLIIGSFASFFGNGYLGRILLISNFSPTAVPNPLGIDLKLAIAAALSYLTIFTGIGGVTFKILDIK